MTAPNKRGDARRMAESLGPDSPTAHNVRACGATVPAVDYAHMMGVADQPTTHFLFGASLQPVKVCTATGSGVRGVRPGYDVVAYDVHCCSGVGVLGRRRVNRRCP